MNFAYDMVSGIPWRMLCWDERMMTASVNGWKFAPELLQPEFCSPAMMLWIPKNREH
jgi:hypothetical protein